MSSPEFIRGLYNLRPRHRGCVATIGSFDGVHLGHQAILQQVTDKARQLGLPSLAMIFEPQPHEYFAGDKAPARLMRLREKLQTLFAAGIDRVLCLQFNAKFSHMSAQDFIDQILIDGLAVKYLVVGDDFRFGAERRGDYQLMKAQGGRYGFDVCDTHTLEVEGERISSTRIRRELSCNRFDTAAGLLGKPYVITGRVVYGKQLGRQLGVPTANVQLRRYRSPIVGVFAVRARLQGCEAMAGRRIEGVANVGVRPTVEGDSQPVLEVHLFDFDEQIYGCTLSVEFCYKLREEQKFASLAALKAQINQDIEAARVFFQAAEQFQADR